MAKPDFNGRRRPMGLNTPSDWIVCYDMKDRKRLARIFKFLKSQGIPIQYSVFLVHASSIAITQLEDRLCNLIDRNEDDVRIYAIPKCSKTVIMGQPLVPDGVLFGEGIQLG